MDDWDIEVLAEARRLARQIDEYDEKGWSGDAAATVAELLDLLALKADVDH
jgi:hypothetical protein